jgi:hypothetical protein
VENKRRNKTKRKKERKGKRSKTTNSVKLRILQEQIGHGSILETVTCEMLTSS